MKLEAAKREETPGKPVAYNDGLLWLIDGLLYGIVACCFGLLGFPGTSLSFGENAPPFG